MKLELKHFDIGDEFYGASDIWKVTGKSIDYVYIDNGVIKQKLTLEDLQADYSLLRRPLSDLTKEIEVNGEKFIPIERLLDISTGHNWSASDYLDTNIGLNEYWTQIKDGGSTFGYNSERRWFFIVNKGSFLRCEKQFDLFQKLSEWHFNVFNLPEELYIDINTIK